MFRHLAASAHRIAARSLPVGAVPVGAVLAAGHLSTTQTSCTPFWKGGEQRIVSDTDCLSPDLSPEPYTIIAGPGMEEYALKLVRMAPDRFSYHPTSWGKFPDGTDNIKVGGFSPTNQIARKNVLFLANFDSNDTTLSQYHALVMLCESFLSSMTVVLPFYPTATMERVTEEGVVATANSTATLLSNLPSCGPPTRVMCYDLHTLQNRFFFSGNAVASLHSAFPLMLRKIKENGAIDAIAFPDDGAEKRYRYLFEKEFPEMEYILCGKKRDPNDPSKRTIVVKDGDPVGKTILIIDDMIQSGGTLTVSAQELLNAGGKSVSGFCTHAILPKNSMERFLTGDRSGVFTKLYVTNSYPTTTDKLPAGQVFEVLDLVPQILEDL